MDILIKALQLVMSLSILVITHEGGHFLFAKLFKTRVEKFYLFFDTWFALFRFKKGETEYGIGWLPLGGYVKIAGMVDESMDTEQLAQPVQPWEFRAKPAWQRLLIMLGGVLVNAVTAPILFWLILFTWGESYLPLNEAKFGMQFHPVLQQIGFQDGDIVTGVDGVEVETIKDVTNPILFGDCKYVNLQRAGQAVDVEIPDEFFRQILSADVDYLMLMQMPIVVDTVAKGSGADLAGLVRGDSIVGVGDKEITSFAKFRAELGNYKDTTAQITLVRAGVADTVNVHIDAEGRAGVILYSFDRWMTPKIKEYNIIEALPAGVAKGCDVLVSYLKQLPMIFSKEGATKVGGFGTIGNMFPAVWNWEAFWFNTAFLAIILAVMNILPIPALDGGHVLFLLVEVVTRRKPSDKFLMRAQTVGMSLLIALIVYANFNDVIRAFFS